MLRCISRYRNASLGLYVEPGEVLRTLTPEQEDYLLRDSPGSFERVTERVAAKAPEAPPVHRMVEREKATRKGSERGHGSVMTRQNMPGLTAPKE